MDKVDRYGWTVNPGKALQYRMLGVERLKIDESYQREKLSEANILSIARDFAWPAFRTLLVARRPNGDLYVVDGQHRLEAAKRRGFRQVPCSVFDSAGAEEEARTFYTCSVKTVHIPATNKYRALITAGDPEMLAIQDMLFGLGLEVSDHGTTDPRYINFPAEIIRTYRMDPDLTRDALYLQRHMVAPVECINHHVHKGLFYVLRRLEGTSNAITHDMAWKVFAAGGKAALLHSINSVLARSGKESKSETICGAGVWAVIKKACRCRFDLGNVA